MTQTRIVLGMEDEHCQGCRTQRRRLLSARHVMRNFDRGDFHGATLQLHAMVRAILIAASDRKGPIRWFCVYIAGNNQFKSILFCVLAFTRRDGTVGGTTAVTGS